MGLAVAGQARGAAGQESRMNPLRSTATSGAQAEQGLGGQRWEMGLMCGALDGGWVEKQGLLDPCCLLSFSHNSITPTAWLSLHVEILLPGEDFRGLIG